MATRVKQLGNREREHKTNRDDSCPDGKQQVDDNDDCGKRNDPLPALAHG